MTLVQFAPEGHPPCITLSVIIRVLLPRLYISDPFPHRITLLTVRLLSMLNIPPPLSVAVLPLMVTLLSVGLLLSLTIPPPNSVELPLIVTFVSVGLLP